MLVMVLVLYFTRERDRAQAAIEMERRRSDLLLLGVLPDEIVERLKAGADVIADEVESATVLFADIAEFTPMSSNMSADEVVALLDEVFRAFDRVAEGASVGVVHEREQFADAMARRVVAVRADQRLRREIHVVDAAVVVCRNDAL